MENTRLKEEAQPGLLPTSSGRRSPDFEFWVVRNPSFPQPELLTADELFHNGVLRPLRLLHPDVKEAGPPAMKSELDLSSEESSSGADLIAVISEIPTQLTASKRWKDILFKNRKENVRKKERKKEKEKEKERKKERKSLSRTSSAELNINIWPFSRSRSAGISGTQPRQVNGAQVNRKVRSAPCSRSNSDGESMSRKWPNSPSRAGVHLGRASPVWQVRRTPEKGVKKEGLEGHRSKIPAVYAAASGGGCSKTRGLNLNVPMCVSYRNQLGCKSDGHGAVSVGSGGRGRVNGGDCSVKGGGSGNLFNLRSLFTKKVY